MTALVAVTGGGSLSHAQAIIDGGSVVNVPGTHASPWNIGGHLIVGGSGNGTLNIGASGMTGVVNNSTASVGFQAGSNGTVTVNGPGSRWVSSDTAVIGDEGTGSLSATNGGFVSSNGVNVGLKEGSSGTVTIDGAGTIWGIGSFANIGYDGTAVLTVSGGAHANVSGGVAMGVNAGSNATATFTGAGSAWSIVHNLVVGYGSTADLRVSNGASVTSENGIVGYGGLGQGSVTVTGAGSSWINSADLHVGEDKSGTLTIADGGVVSNVNGFISYNGIATGASSLVTVTGAGSTWTNSGFLAIGQFGTGGLSIENGGRVDAAGPAYLAGNAGSQGYLTVDGIGSRFNSSSDIYIGYLDFGSVAVSNGGAVSGAGGIVGYGGSGVGAVRVDGAGSTWTNSADVSVGYYGSGTLDITNGGAVSSVNSTVGYQAGSVGAVTVDGAGSNWSNSGNLYVGDSGTGTMAISNGGKVTSFVGYVGNIGTGTVTVSGTNSTWANNSNLNVGNLGIGTLTISSGGLVSNVVGSLGNDAGATGVVNVDGAGSTWANASDVFVGYSGSGTLGVTNGGSVGSVNSAVGYQAGSVGSVTVNGAGSNWVNSGNLYVGDSGTGTMAVSNGGLVTSVVGYVGNIGTGTATVSGANSTWSNTSNLNVGNLGNGTLTISNGGLVNNMVGSLGNGAGATGVVTVDGTGSIWANSGNLNIGYGGTGTLNLVNGGLASIGGVVNIAIDATSIGALNIGGAAGAPAAAAGALNATKIQFGLGAGTISFNHTATNYSFSPAISGMGTINQVAGTTNLTGDSSGFTGATNITGGRLAVNGSLAGSLVTVSGGSLGGAGIVGSIAAGAGGVVAPGNSIGTLNVAGNVTFNPGSVYQVEVNATGQSDKIIAGGTVTITGGSVQVLAGVGNYGAATTYTILTSTGGRSGTFTGGVSSNLAFLFPSLSYDTNNVYLTMSRNQIGFQNVGVTPNQISTGSGVESLGAGNPVYNAVLGLSAPQAQYAFNQLSGEVHASVRTTLIEDSRFVRSALNDRMRAAFDRVGASGMVMTYVDGQAVCAPASVDGLAVWTQGFGSWGQTDGNGNAATINRSTGGLFIGADAPVFETWRLGVAAGYSRTTFNVQDRSSSGSSDNYQVGLYGGTTWGDLALRLGAAYVWSNISTSRSVAFPGFSDKLSGSYNGGTAQAFADVAYGVNAGRARLEPFANLAYVNLYTAGFTEQGGASALTSGSANTGTTFTTLGLRGSTTFDVNRGNLTAKGMLGWRHAFGDVTPIAAMSFAGGGNAFNVGGVPIALNAAVIEAGLDYSIAPNAALGIAYNGQFGSGLSDQSVKANLSVKF